jgi:general secretion pathway protein K
MMRPCPNDSRSRGFALVIVLWSLVMLALFGTQLTATTRAQQRLAIQARDQAVVEAAADGATREAMFVLLGRGQIGSSRRPMHIRIGEADVDILTDDEAGKINPNAVSRDVLRGLIMAVGVDPARAAQIAGEIADWRIRNPASVLGGLKIDQYRERGLPYRSGDRPFSSVDEMALLPDMTPDILARLRPWLSVYHEGSVSDPGGASPAGVAVGDTGLSRANAAGSSFVSQNVVMRVVAAAVVPGRARFVRSAVVRLRTDAATDPGTGDNLIQVLTWE